jgi:hypothetical protein
MNPQIDLCQTDMGPFTLNFLSKFFRKEVGDVNMVAITGFIIFHDLLLRTLWSLMFSTIEVLCKSSKA